MILENNTYLDGFKDLDDLKEQYNITDDDLKGWDIHFAYDDGGGYKCESYVFLEKDGVYYVVDASHCSCYGLEGQWDPIETSREALREEIDAKIKENYKEYKLLAHYMYNFFKWSPSDDILDCIPFKDIFSFIRFTPIVQCLEYLFLRLHDNQKNLGANEDFRLEVAREYNRVLNEAKHLNKKGD